MRHIRLFSWLIPIVFLATGCGPDTGSGSSAFNPAVSVSESLETFKVEDEGGNPYLSRTIFFDIYRGLEPAEGEDDRETASEIRQRLNLLMGLEPNEDGKSYVSARNPFDLLHHLINIDRIGTFNDGKQLMRDSVTSGEPATYNTPAKNAVIRFTDMEDRIGEEPGPDQVWVFPVLDWTSSFSQFEPITSAVFRSAQFIARPAEEDDPEPAEIRSGFWSGEFDGSSFSATGYNQPLFAALSITGRNFGEVEFYQVNQGAQYDTLILRDTKGIFIDGEEPAYICALVSYDTSEVKIVYEVEQEDTDSENDGSPSADVQCPDSGQSFEYQSEPVNSRQ